MARLGHLLRAALGLGREHLVPALAQPFGGLRSNRQTVMRWPEGSIVLGPKVALFCHFDRAGAVRDHVLSYVTSLHHAGFSVVLVSNAGRLRPDALARLQPLCAAILLRRNIGYDFGAWHDALEQLALPRPDTAMLLLANDSVYGPFAPLAPLLDRIDFSAAAAWGATDSWQQRYHLQSYLMAIGPAALASPAWRGFWQQVRPVPSKRFVIKTYEIGLSQALIAGGFRLGALFPYAGLLAEVTEAEPVPRRPARADRRQQPDDGESDAPDGVDDPMESARRDWQRRLRRSAVRREPLNPTNDLWRQLLRAGFPFIKRELLRDNPSRIGDLGDWRRVVGEEFAADLTAIEIDLKRVMRNRVP